MTRKTKASKFLLLSPDLLDSVSKDFVLDLDEQFDDGAFAETRLHPIDEVLIALRKSFSLTYSRNPFIDGLKECEIKIRETCVDAIKCHPELLEELKLPPIPFVIDDPAERKSLLFRFALVRSKDLRIRVKYEGKKQSFFKLLDATGGDQIVRTIRAVVSDSFSEAHDEDQHEEILNVIRPRIWKILPDFNEVLDEINIERMPSQPLQEDA